MTSQTISHFELLEKAGAGGMGTVYRARDIRLGRVVALKFLSPELLESPEQRTRFAREGQTLSALSHPHVATIYEVDETGGKPFLAMEYLSGGTLRSRIVRAGGRLPLASVLEWALGLAEGLEHAHRRGVVHRDVKSGNAMFDADGRIKLTDFGLAIRTSTGLRAEPDGSAAGTLGYMSPEQLRGGAVDHRSDLFSFGVLLYETATGLMPFAGKTLAEVARSVELSEPAPVHALRPEMPEGFAAVVMRLLRKNPDDRYQRTLDLVDDLRACASAVAVDAPTHTALTSAMTSSPHLRRRRWAAVGLFAAVGAWLGYPPLDRWIRFGNLPAKKHVAVLPFRNIGGDASQLAFCDGITETLTSALTRHGSFSVVPSSDARLIESAAQARREYGVNLVISGSVQRRGKGVRVTITLTDARQGRQTEAAPLDWPLEQLPALEDGILAKVADLISLEPMPAPQLLAASQMPSAQDAYLRGRGYLYRYDRGGNLELARQQFEMAVREDPKFALAYNGLAEAQLRSYRMMRDTAKLEAARLSAERAVELNPQLASAHGIQGAALIALGRKDEAAREIEKAIQLDPHDPFAYRELANLYVSQKKFTDAERVFLRAVSTRPGDWMSSSNLGVFYYSQLQYDKAEAMFRKVVEITPDNHIGYRNLASLIVARNGGGREAEELFLKAIALNPTSRAYSNLGAMYMWERRYREAVTVMGKSIELAPKDAPANYRNWGNLGDAYQLSGAPADKARGAWSRAVALTDVQVKKSPDDAELLALRGVYRAKLAEPAALADANAALAKAPGNGTVHYLAAVTFALTGDSKRALKEVEAAVQQKYSPELIRRAPELVRLHAEPEFQRILANTQSQSR